MFKTMTPIDNTVYLERKYNHDKIEDTISNSVKAQKNWAALKVKERVEILKKFVDDFLSRENQIIEEITRQIGRPISQAASELKGFKEKPQDIPATPDLIYKDHWKGWPDFLGKKK